MMAADDAQAVGGKLYVLGGGFDRINLPTLPFQRASVNGRPKNRVALEAVAPTSGPAAVEEG